MLLPIQYIKDSCFRLKKMHEYVTKETEVAFEAQREKFLSISLDMANALTECAFSFKDADEFQSALTILKNKIKEVRASQDVTILKNAICSCTNYFRNKNFDSYFIGNYKDNLRAIYFENFPNYEADYNFCAEALKVNSIREVNALEANCKFGFVGSEFKKVIPSLRLWGVHPLSGCQRTEYHRLAQGKIKDAIISQNSFDVVILDTPIQANFLTLFNSKKTEIEILRHSLQPLRSGGAFIMKIPYFRLYRDMCVLLCKSLRNIQIRKGPQSSFTDNGLVYIMGIRKDDKIIAPDDFNLLLNAYQSDQLADVSTTPFIPMTLPDTDLPIKIFRGTDLTDEDIQDAYKESPCRKQFWANLADQNNRSLNKQPPLPLGVGHIGLVLTSGCLNGIVDEEDGCCHLIKGTTIRYTDVQKDPIDDYHESVTETLSSRVYINAFLPDGTYLTLA